MRVVTRICWSCAWGWLVLAQVGAAFELPAVSGHFAGRMAVPGLMGEVLDWDVELVAGRDGKLHGRAETSAEGLKVAAVADIDAVSGTGTWRLVEGTVDANVWINKLLVQFAPEIGTVTTAGMVRLSGAGTIGADGPEGEIEVAWTGETVKATWNEVVLSGVELKGRVELKAGTVAGAPFELRVGNISTVRFGARNLSATGRLEGTERLAVESAAVEIAGGRVRAEPFALSLAKPELRVRLAMERVGLQDVVALVPQAGLADARGRVGGDIVVTWTEAEGVGLGEGRLTMDREEPATVTLTAAPGFLTGQMPAKFDWVPDWLGPLKRWLALDNPAYPELKAIEMGRAQLAVDSFETRITPEGDGAGRSASVLVRAHPVVGRSVVKTLTFEVNVAGPLKDVLHIGLNQPVTFSVR